MRKLIFGKRMAIVLAMVMFLTSAVFTMPVYAASKPDLKKANVNWDLKNNKTLKFKTQWNTIGAQTAQVKMTKFKVGNAKKKGYKQCTFTMTFTRKIKPTPKQRNKMVEVACGDGEYNSPGGEFWAGPVDYKTGKMFAKGNKQKVKVTYSKWKYSKWETIKSTDGFSFKYAKKASVDVKIVYPKKYKNLAIGAGGFSMAPHWESELTSGSYSASHSGWIEDPFDQATQFFEGKKSFSETKVCWSKKTKNYAHFMRVK